MIRYHLIFPTVEAVLQHLLFTIGTGYDFNHGVITTQQDIPLEEQPGFSSNEERQSFIDACQKEDDVRNARHHADRAARMGKPSRLKLAKIPKVKIDDSMFTRNSLIKQIQSQYKYSSGDDWHHPMYVRPYPISDGYSNVARLDSETPKWLVETAIALTDAWVITLGHEIVQGHYSLNELHDGKEGMVRQYHRLLHELARLYDLLEKIT
jgi:hypothetical protein